MSCASSAATSAASSGSTALTEEWIDAWISRLREHLALHLAEFESRFGYPPDLNSVESEGEFGHSDFDVIAAVSLDLALLYRRIRYLSLPDVGIGLFVHSAQQTVAGLRGALPTRVVGAALDDSVVVFGSDGGGVLFALSRADGRTVYRLPPG